MQKRLIELKKYDSLALAWGDAIHAARMTNETVTIELSNGRGLRVARNQSVKDRTKAYLLTHVDFENLHAPL